MLRNVASESFRSLQRVKGMLVELRADPKWARRLNGAVERLEKAVDDKPDTFRVCFCGDSFTGKTSLVNSLALRETDADRKSVAITTTPVSLESLQQPSDVPLATEASFPPAGVTRTVDYAETIGSSVTHDQMHVHIPSPFLRSLNASFIDMSSLSLTHRAGLDPRLNEKMAANSDLVVFVTSIDRRACDRYERDLLHSVRHTPTLVALNRTDRCTDVSEEQLMLDETSASVASSNASRLASTSVFSTSARTGDTDSLAHALHAASLPSARIQSSALRGVRLGQELLTTAATSVLRASERRMRDKRTLVFRVREELARYENELISEFAKEDWEAIDLTMMKVRTRVSDYFATELSGVRLLSNALLGRIANGIDAAFEGDFLKRIAYRMAFTSGKLSEGGDRELSFAVDELRTEIVEDLAMEEHPLTALAAQETSAALKAVLRAPSLRKVQMHSAAAAAAGGGGGGGSSGGAATAANATTSVPADVDVDVDASARALDDAHELSSRVHARFREFDHVALCRGADADLSMATTQALVLQVLGAAAVSVVALPLLPSVCALVGTTATGYGWLVYRRNRVRNTIHEELNQLQRKVKDDLASAFVGRVHDSLFKPILQSVDSILNVHDNTIRQLSLQHDRAHALVTELKQLELKLEQCTN